jgi:hypothetical protein
MTNIELKTNDNKLISISIKNNIVDKGINRIYKNVPSNTIEQYDSCDEKPLHKHAQADDDIKKLYKLYNELKEQNSKENIRIDKDVEQLFEIANNHHSILEIQEEHNKVVENAIATATEGVKNVASSISCFVEAKCASILNYVNVIKATVAPQLSTKPEGVPNYSTYLRAAEMEAEENLKKQRILDEEQLKEKEKAKLLKKQEVINDQRKQRSAPSS